MALGLYSALNCMEYEGVEPRHPAIRVTIREPAFNRERTLTAPIDTGFAGYLLVTSEIYEELGVHEVPEDEFGVYGTMTGPITLRRARVFLEVWNRTIESYIEVPSLGMGRLLLGRRVLNKLDVGLISTRGICCGLVPVTR